MIIERVLDVKLRKRTGYGAKGSLIDLILTIMAPVRDFLGPYHYAQKGFLLSPYT